MNIRETIKKILLEQTPVKPKIPPFIKLGLPDGNYRGDYNTSGHYITNIPKSSYDFTVNLGGGEMPTIKVFFQIKDGRVMDACGEKPLTQKDWASKSPYPNDYFVHNVKGYASIDDILSEHCSGLKKNNSK